jgi:thiol-disulfide isomerase/thioredoxin
MLRQSLVCLSVAVAGLVGCNRPPASPPTGKGAVLAAGEIGSHLPDFTFRDLQGRALSSTDLHGKVVLVDFWATWCQPCKKEMSGYQKLVDRHGSRGFAVIGFKSEVMRDMEDPLQFAKKIGVKYPLVVATEDLTQKFGGIVGLPTTMLYDRQGILRMKVVGFEYTDTIESALKPLL